MRCVEIFIEDFWKMKDYLIQHDAQINAYDKDEVHNLSLTTARWYEECFDDLRRMTDDPIERIGVWFIDQKPMLKFEKALRKNDVPFREWPEDNEYD